jgi:hypothetical protein
MQVERVYKGPCDLEALKPRHDPEYNNALIEKGSDGQISINVKQQNVEAQQVSGIIINSTQITGEFKEAVFNRLVREPLEVMLQKNSSVRVIILVDALDEALTHGGKVNIVSLLARLDNLPAGVRFIITSRRNNDKPSSKQQKCSLSQI